MFAVSELARTSLVLHSLRSTWSTGSLCAAVLTVIAEAIVDYCHHSACGANCSAMKEVSLICNWPEERAKWGECEIAKLYSNSDIHVVLIVVQG